MWPSRYDKGKNLTFPYSTVIAVVISVISLCISIGVARWSWLILDEQLVLRRDFEKLEMDQRQVEVQYEFWLEQLQEGMRETSEETE